MGIRSALFHPNLSDGASKGIASAMVDVIAIPSGFCRGSNKGDGNNKMALLGEVMEQLESQGQNQMEGARKADLHSLEKC